MCQNRVEAKKEKNLLKYLSDTCCTNSLQVSDTDSRSARIKKQMIYFGHIYEFFDMCHRSILEVSDTNIYHIL
jgi:hypothetical protein